MITESVIGKETSIAKTADVYKAIIGENCKISGFVYIEEEVQVGNNCKIRPFAFIPTGVTIEDGVFIGPSVTFTNDKYPRAINEDGSLQGEEDWELTKTLIKKGTSIGAGATIMCGVTIGEHAMIGAGAVITKDVPDNTVVYCKQQHKMEEI